MPASNSTEIMMVTVSDLVIKSGDYKSIILQAKEYAKEGNIANIINEKEHIGIYIYVKSVFIIRWYRNYILILIRKKEKV